MFFRQFNNHHKAFLRKALKSYKDSSRKSGPTIANAIRTAVGNKISFNEQRLTEFLKHGKLSQKPSQKILYAIFIYLWEKGKINQFKFDTALSSLDLLAYSLLSFSKSKNVSKNNNNFVAPNGSYKINSEAANKELIVSLHVRKCTIRPASHIGGLDFSRKKEAYAYQAVSLSTSDSFAVPAGPAISGVCIRHENSNSCTLAIRTSSSSPPLVITTEYFDHGVDTHMRPTFPEQVAYDTYTDNNIDNIENIDYISVMKNAELRKFFEQLPIELIHMPNGNIEDGEALWWAARQGDLEKVDSLLKRGVDVNYRHPIDNSTPLHKACQFTHMHVIDRLLASRRCDLLLEDEHSFTAMDCLEQDKHDTFLKLCKRFCKRDYNKILARHGFDEKRTAFSFLSGKFDRRLI